MYQEFSSECRYVIDALRAVYEHDANAKELTAQERLIFHQLHSKQILDELEKWLTTQIDEKKAEPNSGLGKAIFYMQAHWTRLTVFLRVAGAPLDNNVCERALKKAIIHRKNSLFYRSLNGARVGDIYMSLIHTCESASESPFEYLTALQRNAGAAFKRPHDWLPWNFRGVASCSR